MNTDKLNFDKWLLFSVIMLIGLGIVMVASASTPTAERLNISIFHFAKNQLIYVSLGIIALYIVTFIPIKLIEQYSNHVMLASIFLLILLLLPGVTHPVNGSIRWIFIGPISFQPSEVAKLALILYMSGYMVRRNYQLKNSFKGFLIPMFVLAMVGLLLLLEPDFGSIVVIVCTILGMLFLGGVQVRHFLVLLPLILCILVFFCLSSSYRVQRFISFRDPWADQFDTGYQLVQALIAFGRGSLFGSGLGGSIQKLLYLPEAHSDFIFAVLAEELGLCGALIVIILYGIFAFRSMEIGRKAQAMGLQYAGNLAYGLGLLISLQALINIGVNIGVLPTKGLTLPLMSAGGSSLVIACIGIGLLFRVDFEVRMKRQTSMAIK